VAYGVSAWTTGAVRQPEGRLTSRLYATAVCPDAQEPSIPGLVAVWALPPMGTLRK